MRIKPAILIAAASVLALSGCNTASKALGLAKVTPDEFRIVTKAPLVVPPDYALRPPAPGEPRPQELQPDSAARAVLVGQVQAADRSAGENRFVARAGAAQPDPLIRFVVDDENGGIAHKDQSFASRVMFWKKGDDNANVGATAPTAAAPAQPNAALTGTAPVVIAKNPGGRIKLPGL
jgi:hypothetical protein